MKQSDVHEIIALAYFMLSLVAQRWDYPIMALIFGILGALRMASAIIAEYHE